MSHTVNHRHAALTVATFVTAILTTRLTIAQQPPTTFSPTVCSQCPTMTEVDYSFRSQELPVNFSNACTGGACYLNNIDYTRYFFASRYVKQFDFYLSSFNTEPTYDYLYATFDPGTPTLYFTGNAPIGYRSITAPTSFQLHPIRFNFHTDSSVTSDGFSIGPTKARVCCDNSLAYTTPVNQFVDGKRVTGVLLDSKDVVYLWSGVGASTQVRNIALWSTSGTVGRDFDLYARCNALPTPTAWDYRGYSGDTQEFITWQEPGVCSSPGTLYVAIHSFIGSGDFSIVQSNGWTATHQSTRRVRVGVNFNASTAQLATISDTLSQAGRIFFGMTEGQALIDRFYLFNNRGNGGSSDCAQSCGGGNSCQICFKETGSGCGGWSPQCGMNMASQPILMAHELGHLLLHLPDEYAGFGVPQCGHSIMGNPWGNAFNLCTGADHNSDGSPGAGTSTAGANWPTLPGTQMLYKHTSTPDNNDYMNHDFNGMIDVRLMP